MKRELRTIETSFLELRRCCLCRTFQAIFVYPSPFPGDVWSDDPDKSFSLRWNWNQSNYTRRSLSFSSPPQSPAPLHALLSSFPFHYRSRYILNSLPMNLFWKRGMVVKKKFPRYAFARSLDYYIIHAGRILNLNDLIGGYSERNRVTNSFFLRFFQSVQRLPRDDLFQQWKVSGINERIQRCSVCNNGVWVTILSSRVKKFDRRFLDRLMSFQRARVNIIPWYLCCDRIFSHRSKFLVDSIDSINLSIVMTIDVNNLFHLRMEREDNLKNHRIF